MVIYLEGWEQNNESVNNTCQALCLELRLLMSVFLDMFDIGLYDMAIHVRFVFITC